MKDFHRVGFEACDHLQYKTWQAIAKKRKLFLENTESVHLILDAVADAIDELEDIEIIR